MTTLLLAETAGGALAPATAKALTAAREIGGAVHILVAGSGLRGSGRTGGQARRRGRSAARRRRGL